MRRPVRLRVTACACALAATAAAGVLLAPAAHADPDRQRRLPEPTKKISNAQYSVPDGEFLGRKIV